METGRFAGVYSRGGVGGCPVGLEGVQGKRGANTGTVGGVGGSLTVEAAGNAQGEGVQNPSGEPVARPRPRYFARAVKIAETGEFGRPCVVPVGVGRVDVLGAGVCAYRRAGARDDWPPFLQAKQGNFRRIYSTSGIWGYFARKRPYFGRSRKI